MIFTNVLINYLSIQDDESQYKEIIEENKPSTVSISSNETNAIYEIKFNSIILTQQPKKVVQLQFETLEDMQTVTLLQMRQKGSQVENQAEIVKNEEQKKVVLYITESSIDQILDYELVIGRQEASEQEVSAGIFAIQDVVLEERRVLSIERKQFYGYYKPTQEQTLIMQIKGVAEVDYIPIYTSQDNLIPSTETDRKLSCTKQSDGSIACTLTDENTDYTKPIYIYASLAQDVIYQLSIAPEGYFLTELFEDQQTTIIMNGNYQQDYIFQPFWYSYNFQKVSSDKTLFQIEMNNEMLQKLIDLNVDIYGHISRLTNPNTRLTAHSFSFKQHAIIGEENKAMIKHIEFINNPQESNLFITFVCDGENCSQLQQAEFNLTINTMNEITQWKPAQAQYIQYRDNITTQNFYFSIEEYMQSTIDILLPENKNKYNTEDCSKLKYNVIACLGTYPDKFIRENLDQATCQEYEYDEEEQKVQFKIDTKFDSYQSGMIFVRVEVDSTGMSKGLAQISQCYSKVNLYSNKQVKTFGEPEVYYLASGYGQAKALHLAADVPLISQKAAVIYENGTKQYGDRLILEWSASQEVYVCISDDPNVYYPYYTENQNTCTLFYNQKSTRKQQQIIYFKNYMNNKIFGRMQSSTRVYISVWPGQNVEDGKIVSLNLTIAPQLYMRYDQKMNEGVAFSSHFINGLEKYISFGIDVDGQFDSIKNGSFIVGPDVDNDYYRDNTPEAFYQQNIITYASCDTKLPYQDEYMVKANQKGLQVISIQNVSKGQFDSPKDLYIQMYYRRHDELKYNRNGRSQIGYKLYYVQDFNENNQLRYQSVMSVNANQEQQDQQHFYLNNPYVPSELVIMPCKGTQQFYIDDKSFNNTQKLTPIVPQDQGHASYYIFNDNNTRYINQYLTVDSTKGGEYKIFFGNQANINTPGNDGQITVEKFDGSNNELKIRIAPARVPLQTEAVSQVNYYIYAIPYQGSLNLETDYSPFTKCGVDKIGYSLYKNEQGLDNVVINDTQVQEDGYITIQANQDLYQNNANKDAQLYIQVFAGDTPYYGVLVGSDSGLKTGEIVAISVSCVLAVIIVLVVVFIILRKKQMKNKQQGYKEQQA